MEHYQACIKSNDKVLTRRPNIAEAYITSAQCEYFNSLFLLVKGNIELVGLSIEKQLQRIEQALIINNKLASAYTHVTSKCS